MNRKSSTILHSSRSSSTRLSRVSSTNLGINRSRSSIRDDDNEDDHIAFEILNSLEYTQERESVNLTRLFDSLFIAFTGNRNILKNVKIELDTSYNGLTLGESFEENDFRAMYHDLRNNRKLHAKYAFKIFDEAIKILKVLPNIQEIELSSSASSVVNQCVVIGDLHGHFDDLVGIISNFDIPGKCYYYVFNGDWVDRGDQQIEVLLTIFYSFILYPTRVLLNRGNHEDYTQNSHNSYKPCLRTATNQYFEQYGTAIYTKIDELFRYLPLGTIINNPEQRQRIFVVHGGINDELNLDIIQKLDRTKYTSICKRPNELKQASAEAKYFTHVQDMLWSDPYPSDDDDDRHRHHKNGQSPNYVRNIGKHFGANVTHAFLKRNNLTLIIRSHECKAYGFKVMHNGKLITIFSASNYNQSNEGSIILVSPKKTKFDIIHYLTKKKTKTSIGPHNEDNLTVAIKQLRTHLYKIKPQLMQEFNKLDKSQTGIVKIDDLINVLKRHIPNVPYYKIKDRICECDDKLNKAKYETLFSFISIKTKYKSVPEYITQNYQLLQNIFQKIDKDNSGHITFSEFKDACSFTLERLGIRFTPNEMNSFMKAMDTNKDGLIDLQEFNNAFSVTFTN